jgi:hypothetical protein
MRRLTRTTVETKQYPHKKKGTTVLLGSLVCAGA